MLCADQTTSFTRRSQLGDVDRNLGRADTNTKPVDETTNYEHADVLRSTHKNGADNPVRRSVKTHRQPMAQHVPDDGSNHDGFLSTEHVREEAGKQSANP